MFTLITGGCRSGKSAHAIRIASSLNAPRKVFVATAEALDDEMRVRIAHHRRSRPANFDTVEEPRNLCGAIAALDGRADVVVVDCLTLWISNLLQEFSDEAILGQADRLTSTAIRLPFSTIIVTDEIGGGIVPANPVARRFRDLLGWTNQKIARDADEVLLMVAGCAVRVK